MFITFEGCDGCGKTTIMNRLIVKLLELKPQLSYVLTREPGGKDIKEAEKIRELILDKNSQLSLISEALLFTASRRIHLERVIWPALKENKLVLCDRYVDSFYAYQGAARNLGISYVKKLTNMVIENTMPDLTIFLDISLEESKRRRLESRLVQDRLDSETETFHKKVYNAYQKIVKAEPQRFIVVNASQSIEDVLNETLNKLLANKTFKKWFDKVGK